MKIDSEKFGRREIALFTVLAAVITVVFVVNIPGEEVEISYLPDLTHEGVDVTWLGNSGFKFVSGDKVIYIDPTELTDNGSSDNADIIIITHWHADHLSRNDIAKIITNETTVYSGSYTGVFDEFEYKEINFVEPGDTEEYNEDISLSFTPSYALKNNFHPKEMKYTGVVVDIGGVKIYHPGDSEPIEEMRSLSGINIVLLPLNEYVMTVDEMITCISYVSENSPTLSYAIPMDYNPSADIDIKMGKELLKKGDSLITFLEIQ